MWVWIYKRMVHKMHSFSFCILLVKNLWIRSHKKENEKQTGIDQEIKPALKTELSHTASEGPSSNSGRNKKGSWNTKGDDYIS